MNIKHEIELFLSEWASPDMLGVKKAVMRRDLTCLLKDLLDDIPQIENCNHINEYGKPLHDKSRVEHVQCIDDWYNLAVEINEWRLKKLKELEDK